LLRSERGRTHGRLYQASERAFDWLLAQYERSLSWVLRHARLAMLVAAITLAINVYLFMVVPKGFFPEQDNGRLMGAIQADQDTSFQAMQERFAQFVEIVMADPAVDTVAGFTGGNQGTANTGRMFVSLKPITERTVSADDVIARLRPKLAGVPGASLYLQAIQDIRVGGRLSNALFQFTLQGDNLHELDRWAPRMLAKLQTLPDLADVNTDQQNRGLEATVTIDRDTAARLGVTPPASRSVTPSPPSRPPPATSASPPASAPPSRAPPKPSRPPSPTSPCSSSPRSSPSTSSSASSTRATSTPSPSSPPSPPPASAPSSRCCSAAPISA